MIVRLKSDLVQRNKVLKAGEVVELADTQAKYLISVNRAEKALPVKKEDKAVKETKELKAKKDTK